MIRWGTGGRIGLLFVVGLQAGCTEGSRSPLALVPLSTLASQVAAEARHHPLVIVGESSHGVDEFGRFKLEIVRALHQQGHARLILLESPFAGSYGLSPLDSSRSATAFLDSTTYRVWHTTAYRDLITYLRSQASIGDTIHLVCVDPNLLGSQRESPFAGLLGPTFTVTSDSTQVLVKVARLLDELHTLETKGQSNAASTRRANALIQLGRNQLAAESNAALSGSIRRGIAVARALFDSFEMWGSASADSGPASQMLLRDRRMARLVELAREDLYPNQATVLLTHNWHARRRAERVTAEAIPGVHGFSDGLYAGPRLAHDEFISLGGLLTRTQPESAFVVGLYFGEGAVGLNDRSVARIPPARTGTMEHRVLARTPGGGAVTFASARWLFTRPWWNQEQAARYSGLWEEQFIPSEQYDCVVVLPRATPPAYTD